jgi:hypothetical protein
MQLVLLSGMTTSFSFLANLSVMMLISLDHVWEVLAAVTIAAMGNSHPGFVNVREESVLFSLMSLRRCKGLRQLSDGSKTKRSINRFWRYGKMAHSVIQDHLQAVKLTALNVFGS